MKKDSSDHGRSRLPTNQCSTTAKTYYDLSTTTEETLMSYFIVQLTGCSLLETGQEAAACQCRICKAGCVLSFFPQRVFPVTP